MSDGTMTLEQQLEALQNKHKRAMYEARVIECDKQIVTLMINMQKVQSEKTDLEAKLLTLSDGE